MRSDQKIVVYQKGLEAYYRNEDSSLEIFTGNQYVTVRMLTHPSMDLYDYWHITFSDDKCKCIYNSSDFPQQTHSCEFTQLCDIGCEALKAYVKSHSGLQNKILDMILKVPEKKLLFFKDKLRFEGWSREEQEIISKLR